jgi:hypothetical protein
MSGKYSLVGNNPIRPDAARFPEYLYVNGVTKWGDNFLSRIEHRKQDRKGAIRSWHLERGKQGKHSSIIELAIDNGPLKHVRGKRHRVPVPLFLAVMGKARAPHQSFSQLPQRDGLGIEPTSSCSPHRLSIIGESVRSFSSPFTVRESAAHANGAVDRCHEVFQSRVVMAVKKGCQATFRLWRRPM